MSERAKRIAEELRNRLRVYNDFIGLYLYGSQVSGKIIPDSDIDIVAVFKNDKNSDDDIILPAWELEIENDTIIDFHPYSVEQLELNTFFYNEVRKGIYYAR